MSGDFIKRLELDKGGNVIDCYDICRTIDERAEEKHVSLEDIFDDCTICPFNKYLKRLARFETAMEAMENLING